MTSNYSLPVYFYIALWLLSLIVLWLLLRRKKD